MKDLERLKLHFAIEDKPRRVAEMQKEWQKSPSILLWRALWHSALYFYAVGWLTFIKKTVVLCFERR